MSDTTSDELKAERIKAIIREREGYVARGLDERVDAVDAELKRLGHSAKAPAKRAQTRSK